jgi:hypothetical protein
MAIKRDAADKWFSNVVRKKAGYVCEHCHKVDARMECAHIYGRAAKSVRWSLDNAVCLLMKTNKKLRLEIAKHYREELKKMDEDENYEPVSYN